MRWALPALVLCVLKTHCEFFFWLLFDLLELVFRPCRKWRAICQFEKDLYRCAAHFERRTRGLPDQQGESTSVFTLPVVLLTLIVLKMISCFGVDVGVFFKCAVLFVACVVNPGPWE
jgi:hypothetical protein